MKKLYLLIGWVIACYSLAAQDPAYPAPPPTLQNITEAEYFIDTDPGFGQGTVITLIPGTSIVNTPVSINTVGLTTGPHRLFIRTKNLGGVWSISTPREFLYDADPVYSVAGTIQNIEKAEYFVDTDPGFGNGISISISPGTHLVNIPATINTTGLLIGTHRLCLRTLNAEGKWSISYLKDFLVDSDPTYPAAEIIQNIVAAEYFIDADPGIGNAIPVSVSAGVDISNISIQPSLVGLSNGAHRLYLRSLGANGRWGITQIREFLFDADPAYTPLPSAPGNIIKAEYFIDTDPGFGNGIIIPFTASMDINNLQFIANTTGLSNGQHTLFVRSLDDWSITNYNSFMVGSSLPLRFLSFNVVASGNNTLLTWKTDNEINTSHFEVECSNDGIAFTKIGEVASKNTGGVHHYNFTHFSPAATTHYYRLKQVDLDGHFVYSVIVRLSRQPITNAVIYPNPASEIVNIKNINAAAVAQVQVINTEGRMMMQAQPNSAMQFRVHHMPNGLYLLRIIKKDNTVQTFSFTKQ